MLEPAARSQLAQRFRTIRIVFLAMVISVVLYVGLGYFVLRSQSSPERGTVSEGLQLGFYGLGAGLIGAILLIRRRFLPSPDQFMAPDSNLPSLMAKYQKGHVLLFVLSEAVALLGLVLSFLSGSMVHLFRFVLVALVLMIVSYPRKVD